MFSNYRCGHSQGSCPCSPARLHPQLLAAPREPRVAQAVSWKAAARWRALLPPPSFLPCPQYGARAGQPLPPLPHAGAERAACATGGCCRLTAQLAGPSRGGKKGWPVSRNCPLVSKGEERHFRALRRDRQSAEEECCYQEGRARGKPPATGTASDGCGWGHREPRRASCQGAVCANPGTPHGLQIKPQVFQD